MRLENWSVVSHPWSPYQPPELATIQIHGEVYGNPRFFDGEPITTSTVQDVIGNQVHTLNSVYELGQPSAKYIQWCKDNNHSLPTPGEPIKFKKA